MHEEELKELKKNNKHTAKWSDLTAEVKNWITNHRNNRICVSKNILFFRPEDGWLHTTSLIFLGHFVCVTDL